MGYIDYKDYIRSVILPKKCRQNGINEGEVRMAFAKIAPILTKSEKANPFMQYEIYRHFQEFKQLYFPNMQTWSQAVSKTIDGGRLDHRESNILVMVSYMTIAESAYKYVVDWLCCMLVAGGADHQFRKKNAGNCEGISKEALGKKCSFLKGKKLNQIADAFDADIRNAAAHLSFKIEQNGVHIYPLDKYGIPERAEERVINLDREYSKLLNGTLVWYQTIVHCYDMYHSPYKHFSESAFATEESVMMVENAVVDMQGFPQTSWSEMARTAEDKFRVVGNR